MKGRGRKTSAPKIGRENLKAFETQLLEFRARVLKGLDHFGETYTRTTMQAATGELSAYTYHMADRGTDAMEREQAFLLASKEGRLLVEIDEALRKIYSGKGFGRCERCGGSIGRDRLKALPYARLCLACQRAVENPAGA